MLETEDQARADRKAGYRALGLLAIAMAIFMAYCIYLMIVDAQQAHGAAPPPSAEAPYGAEPPESPAPQSK